MDEECDSSFIYHKHFFVTWGVVVLALMIIRCEIWCSSKVASFIVRRAEELMD